MSFIRRFFHAPNFFSKGVHPAILRSELKLAEEKARQRNNKLVASDMTAHSVEKTTPKKDEDAIIHSAALRK